MAPRSGSVLGGTGVRVAGPCLDPTDRATCVFNGVEVEGMILSELLVFCVSPYLLEIGRRPFSLRVLREDGTLKYEGESIFYSCKCKITAAYATLTVIVNLYLSRMQ